MDLVYLVLGLALIGFLVWTITTKIPMDANFALLIRIVIIIVVILYLLRRFGGSVPNLL